MSNNNNSKTEQKRFVIVPFGGAGVGKSTLCNFLIDGKDCAKFKASKTTEGGQTQKVTSTFGKALGDNKSTKEVKVFDVPGIADVNIPIEAWIQAIKDGIRSDEKIDVALIVIKATDYRIDIVQMATIKAAKKFLENLKAENIYLCLTHCDNNPPDEKFIKSKIESYKKYGQIDILEENVILFDNTKESLEEFVDNIVPGDMHIVEDIDEALEEYENEMPVIAKQVDTDQQANLAYMWELLMEMQRESRPIFYNENCGKADDYSYDDGGESTEETIPGKISKHSFGKEPIVNEDLVAYRKFCAQKGYDGRVNQTEGERQGLPKGSTKEGKIA